MNIEPTVESERVIPGDKSTWVEEGSINIERSAEAKEENKRRESKVKETLPIEQPLGMKSFYYFKTLSP